MSDPSAWTANIRQDRTDSPFTSTVHASAHAVLAPDVGTGQLDLVSEEVTQKKAGLDGPVIGRPVDGQSDGQRLTQPLRPLSQIAYLRRGGAETHFTK